MSEERHNTGTCSEQMVSAYLAAKGFGVFFPAQSQSRCDLIYLNGYEPVKVQVKTGTKSKSGPYQYEQVRLVNRGYLGNSIPYNVDEIDELWVVGTHLWRFPSDLIAGKTSLYLNTNNPNPNRRRRNYDPDKFIVVNGSWDFPYRNRLMTDQ